MNKAGLQILQEEGNSLISEIRRNLASTGTNATTKTSRSLRMEVEDKEGYYRLLIFGRPFFFTVETGRRPTPDKKPSREMITNIREWVKARGKDDSLTWAIATQINKLGTLLFRKGGRTDIVTSVITDTRIDQIARAVLNQFAKEFRMEVKNIFK